MATTAKVVRCIANFSRASLSPALTLQIKVDLGKRQIYASNFINKTGLNPPDVGNSLTAGIPKQTTIIDAGYRAICLDMKDTTPTIPRVVDAILSLHTGLCGNPHSCTYTYSWEATKAIDVACQQAGRLIGAHPKDIIFTRDTAESNNLLIKCVAIIYKSNTHIITWKIQHMCVWDSCRHLQAVAYDYKYRPIKNNGLINREHLRNVICPDTALVSIMMVNTEVGVIQPMEIEKLGRKKGVFFCTHGAQTVGNIPVDVGNWNDDLTSISGPKADGPEDIGVRNTGHR
ncbi:pyridoxal phosphate-dependent transferase [Tuber brumale]|nr:pyridoxal phosphate-dependent transferase [Tuber brumale]